MNQDLIVDAYPTREAWLDARRDPTSIGASEASAVLGVSPHMTAWGFFEHKMHPRNEKRSAVLRRGHRWESAVLAEYEDESGNRVTTPGDRFGKPGHLVTLARRDLPWLRESPDAFARGADGEEGHAEAKTAMRAGEWTPERGIVVDAWRDEFASLIPPHIAIQAYVQLAVTGLPWNDVCALVPQNGWLAVRWVRMMADASTQDEIVEALAEWRERHLVRGEVPTITGDEACTRHFGRGFAAPAARMTRIATNDERADILRARELRDEIEQREDERSACTNRLIAAAVDGGRIATTTAHKSPYVQVERCGAQTRLDLDALRAEAPALVAKHTKPVAQGVRLGMHRFPKE